MAEKTNPCFFVYCPANFELLPPQKTPEELLGQSYNPPNLKCKMLPVLGR